MKANSRLLLLELSVGNYLARDRLFGRLRYAVSGEALISKSS